MNQLDVLLVVVLLPDEHVGVVAGDLYWSCSTRGTSKENGLAEEVVRQASLAKFLGMPDSKRQRRVNR